MCSKTHIEVVLRKPLKMCVRIWYKMGCSGDDDDNNNGKNMNMKSHSNSSVYCSRKSMWWINERHEQQLCMIFENQFEWLVKQSSLKRTLKIAWRVRRWRSVNTKRGFLGCCGCSGESSFLLQAEKYREKRVFQQDSWNSSKSFFPALLLRRRPYFFALEKWLLKLQLFVVPICNQMQLVFYSTLLRAQPIVDRISLRTIWAT